MATDRLVPMTTPPPHGLAHPALKLAVDRLIPAWFTRYHAALVPLVVFLIYINAPAVAVRFHRVPSAIAQLALAPLALTWGYYLIRGYGLVVTRTLRWIVGLIGVQFVSSLLSENPLHSIESVKVSILEGLILYGVFTNIIRSERTLRHCFWGLLAAGAFMGSLSILQYGSGDFDRTYGGFAQVAEGEGFYVEQHQGEVRQRRLAGPIGEQNRYAQFMLMLLPIGAACVMTTQSRKGRLVALSATMLVALGAATTFSRGGAVGFAMMLLLAAAIGLVPVRHLVFLFLAGSAMFVVLPQYRARLVTLISAMNIVTQSSVAEDPDGAIKGRATSMLATARIWWDHPILGVGPDLSQFHTRQYGLEGGMRSLEGNRKAHCLYLEFAAELGTVGLSCFGLMMATTFRSLIRVRHRLGQKPGDFAGIAATATMMALVTYLTTGIFLHFSYVRYFWLMLAMADATSTVAELEDLPRWHGESQHE